MQREPTLADQVYDRLLRAIMTGDYALNARLPAEESLAVACGVSRPVLRMALARLRDDGIVAARRGSGNYVLRRPAASVVDFVPLGSITDIQRCYEFRLEVESAAAFWAAQRRTEADLAAMRAAHDRMEALYTARDKGVEADQALHLAVGRATHNPFFASVLDSLASQIGFGMNLSRSLTLQAAPDRQAEVMAEHAALIDAIAAQNPDAARAAMQAHIAAARDRMFEGG
ncbi:FadR/GntR family transcriptional regulator [Szabonella alba]|uniref:FadR family transcriptional regulator n=1 Tax=Szabonella alba TaxID=2804194 RepID=A0A8K0VAF5_9RHOB|nr:FadR/GntR family transcriptional regulator [Szabonella alba]MBL4918071.1 FadR family transcriptional regulator [Szabonella alba]